MVTVITLNPLGLLSSSRGTKDIPILPNKWRASKGNKEIGKIKKSSPCSSGRDPVCLWGRLCPRELCASLLPQCRHRSCSQSCAKVEKQGRGAGSRERLKPLPAAVAGKTKPTAVDLHVVSGLLLLCWSGRLHAAWSSGCCVYPLSRDTSPGCGNHPTPLWWYLHCYMRSPSHSLFCIRALPSLGKSQKIVLEQQEYRVVPGSVIVLSGWKSQGALPGLPSRVKPRFNWQQNPSSALLLVL